MLYLHLHQPRRLRRLTAFDADQGCFDAALEREELLKTARTVHLPALELLRDRIPRYAGRLQARIWLSGLMIDQLAQYSPATLDSLRRLLEGGGVEFLAESYYHSLAFVYSPREFAEQVELHARRVRAVFGRDPSEPRGSPPRSCPHEGMRQHKDRQGKPAGSPDAIHIQIDDQADLNHIAALVDELLGGPGEMGFAPLTTHPSPLTPNSTHPSPLTLHSSFAGWVAAQGDLSPWLAGTLQSDALHAVYRLERQVTATKDPTLLHLWRCLQASDLFAAMRLSDVGGRMSDPGGNWKSDELGIGKWEVGSGEDRVSAAGGPYDAYLYFMTALDHLASRGVYPRAPACAEGD